MSTIDAREASTVFEEVSGKERRQPVRPGERRRVYEILQDPTVRVVNSLDTLQKY